jgi:hypothetical protein
MGEQQSVFLNDGSILPWERPLREERISMLHLYNGSTKLLEQIGFDTLDENIGPFLVRGSAAKYLADILHLGKYPFGEPDGDQRREILFVGGLTIYRNGKIPGTDIEGYDLERHGKIWVAKSPEDRYRSSDGLRNLILENSEGPARIEAILAAYQEQDDGRAEAQIKREHKSWQAGRQQGEVDVAGFGL